MGGQSQEIYLYRKTFSAMSFRPMSPTKPQQSLFRLTGNEKLSRRQSYKGKERAVDDVAKPPSPSVYSFVPRPPSASSMSGGSVPTSPNSKRSSVLSTASTSSRNSTLLEFTPFRFGRKKKPPPRQNPNLRMNLILPDVLEISAANSISTPPAGDDVNNPLEDEEARERDRLREEAAQALGLARHRDEYSESGHSVGSNGTLREEGLEHIDASAPNNEYRYRRSPLTSTTSLHPLSLTSPTIANRNRSGSMPPAFQPQPQSAPQITPVPPFPSTPRALTSFTQAASSGILPKYYPSSSLRIFTFNKQWKGRHLVLTSPVALLLSGRVHVSYLHLFKSASPDERELERLEINEDSVVFVSEEEIGGRKGVVQVAGVDVGYVGSEAQNASSKKDVKAREQVMWLFYIVNPLEKQRWIESIKTKVFGQRTIRAGLGSSTPSSGMHEPRGDMDVMMSIRAQGIIRSSEPHTSLPNSFGFQEYSATGNGHAILPTSPTTATGSHSGHDAASVSSTRSSKKAPRPSSSHSKHTSSPGIASGAVLSLKGLFGSSKASVSHASGRPRSSSRASIMEEFADPSRGTLAERNDSIATLGSAKSSTIPKGNNLISILRASSPALESNGFHSPGSSLGMGVHTPPVDFAALGINPTPIQTPRASSIVKYFKVP
ncbi:hypothetical protein BDP27DRAFT_1413256 [Rhodocollybia butyracea]|uniref:PH domain-containing protein n=1 Tax=Rhodocollybia butyracea TaxID=206335 RepID=A0A9P5Q9J9_9AGAR|nr:hypothetical protein BDP27DRAFT_1413256 [Rhodocollybia butyracea]